MGDWDPSQSWASLQAGDAQDAVTAYAETRERCPVARVDGVLGGFWAVLDHDLIVQSALDVGTFSNVVPFFRTVRPPLECDPPEHTAYRRMLNPYFSPSALRSLEDPLVKTAHELLEPLVGAGSGDFAQGFSHPYPTRALCLLLAVPDEDWRLINDWALRVDEIGGQTAPGSPERLAVGEELRPYMTELIDSRRAQPGDDVVSALVRGDPSLPPLDDEAILGIVMMLLSAGHNTTTSAIGNTVLRLARNAELQRAVRADAELIPPLVEEIVRVDAPQQAMRRVATRETELGGRRIAAGDWVWLVFGSGNLDPKAIDDPSAVKIDRKPNRHLGFGRGIHQCVGAPLARLEVGVVLKLLFELTSDIRLTGPVVRPEWPRLGVSSMPLAFQPAAHGRGAHAA
jgi:cytochrome P450